MSPTGCSRSTGDAPTCTSRAAGTPDRATRPTSTVGPQREEQAEAAERTRRSLARTELAWLRRGAPARTSKPKARIATATALVEARPDAPARAGELGLALGSQRLGSKGVELRDVSFAWPDGTVVLDHVSMALEPGDRIGVVGANGAGKSTLLDLIADRLVPTAGAVVRGATVQRRLLRPARPDAGH